MCIRDSHDIDRIVRYHLEPINVSFQTTNPELRCKMLHNRFAGEALKKVDRLYAVSYTHLDVYKRQPIEGVEALVEFMKKFEKENL